MDIEKLLIDELDYLNSYKMKSITISTTAKHALDFRILPRRIISNLAMSCFMINNEEYLKETLSFFDGKVDYIYIDVEQKQNINLYKIARIIVKESRIVNVKPNDITLESCDLLIRNYYKDDLANKKVVVIGTGNLASKIAIRIAERQAQVYIKGRKIPKEQVVINALNFILPKYNYPLQSFSLLQGHENVDVIISFLSGQFTEEESLIPHIGKHTLIIDGGINNFSKDFIQQMLNKKINITRLDTRIALPYQMLSTHDYTIGFFNEIFGQAQIQGVKVASGGYIGSEGTVIVDNIKQPNQVIGIADGRGGVKASEQLSETDRNRIHEIEKAISRYY
ncbi:hypothetical protein [Oceanobacillus damuensis]|uniref:hypothetical protein n=1 Tax=Oceanobacillus damuensis TaxID=937928 RepID=UPI000829DE48|nr:hypothetical protein [Oceanobacillus damuensis]